MVFSELVPISGGLVEIDSLHKLFTLSAFRTPPYLKLEAPDFRQCRHVVAAASTLARAACHEVYRNAICLTIPRFPKITGERCTSPEHKKHLETTTVNSSHARGYGSGLDRIHFSAPPESEAFQSIVAEGTHPMTPQFFRCGQDSLSPCSLGGPSSASGTCV
ncbi:hypothetical protein LTR54_013406 [Friedmanniomyces endolithicus]|uniref:Uncharacterized protein n=1 Tax=Friedmanniomyces endolithicus TaxID=329885 RepID=A0AAN6JBY9_9PEZI|nr:hypothetical protein LTR82_010261 [Friedmanniomyces endolithicus]KAK0986590.1 hypothetical protein LTR54_013406 [Friedmanniomyces endolithicus]